MRRRPIESGERWWSVSAAVAGSRDEHGFMLIEALLIILMISITVAAFAILVPMQMRLQRMATDRGRVADRIDRVNSWADKFIGPAESPLGNTANDSLDYSVLAHRNESENLCYRVELHRTGLYAHQVTAQWGAMVGDPLHCPATLDLPAAGPLVLAEDVVNQPNEPLFAYYVSSDESVPVEAGTPTAKNANSVTLALRIDNPDDFAGAVLNHFRILFGGAIVSRSFANGAVHEEDLAAGAVTPAKIADNTIRASALPASLITTFDDIPVVSNSTRNFMPGDASDVGRWHNNALSPAIEQGGVSFTAGNASAASMVVGWHPACRSGFKLEARGLYTVYNPPGGGSVNIGVRLVGYAGLNLASGFAAFSTPPVSVPAGQYIRRASDWQQIDLGHCATGNFVIGHSPFLYRLQTRSNLEQPYGVVNALIELRYTPEVPPTDDPVPLTAEALSPLLDSDVTVSPSIALTGRFLEADPNDNDGLLKFQLCDTTDCATPLDSGQTHNGIANGGSGSWLSNYQLVAGHVYYWRVRGVDHAGQSGPWSSVVILHAVAPI